jgi:acetyl esterase/lipase
MHFKKILMITLGLLVYLSSVVAAAEPKVELLWPEGAPGAKGDKDGDKPSLTIYLPPKDKANGASVVICPGGGYGHLAMDHEGHQVARWLNSLGVAGFILKYRHRGVGYSHPAPLQDVQRAISKVRCQAKEYKIDPERIGVMGFSAGGHLASTAGTHFHKGKANAKDPVNRVSCRPDFMILVYPVISFTESFTHVGSRNNLLGQDADTKLIEKFSNEKQVTPDTPPAFLVHTWEDKAVPAENSIYFYLALRKAKVPAEMHLYLKGRHGFGLNRTAPPTSTWPTRCGEWLKTMELLEKNNIKN